jgi:HPt (histidine-containing phosphotransfer) domain-containing protein
MWMTVGGALVNTPLIDAAVLAEQTFEDADLRHELLTMLLDQAPVLLNALEASEGVARADVAHRLKGSALALAALPLAGAAGALEDAPDDAEAFTRLRAVLQATLAEVRRLLAA